MTKRDAVLGEHLPHLLSVEPLGIDRDPLHIRKGALIDSNPNEGNRRGLIENLARAH